MKLDDVRGEIVEALKAGESQRSLAKRLGVARSTLQHYIGAQLDGEVPKPEPVLSVPREEILTLENRELRALLKKARTSDVQTERIVEAIYDAVTPARLRFEPLPYDPDREIHPHKQVLLLSDLHGGEVVNAEALDGLGEYNWEILLERMQSIHRSLRSFAHNRPYQIDELQVWMLGDMVSGAIHQEIAETNQFPAAEQAFKVGMVLGEFIENLVPHYPKVVVYGVAGNHGRLTKERASKRVFDNFDWLAYRFAEVHLREYIAAGVVECHFPNSGFVVADVADLKFLLFHGDGIKSTMVGVPWGGVIRFWAKIKAQYAATGTYLSGAALGHFHDPNALGGNLFVNGAVKGGDEWTLKQFGHAAPPEQLLITFDPRKKRKTDVSSINP